MAWLKVYEWEQLTYPQFNKVRVSRSDADGFLKKFARHFKVPAVLVDKSNRNRGGGRYIAYLVQPSYIQIGYEASLGLLVHEFAHHLTRCKYGRKQGHNKNFKRCLKTVYTFAKRYLPPAPMAGSNPINTTA